MEDFPSAAELPTVTVKVLVLAVELGERVAVIPFGGVPAIKLTV